jgi:hypothetical protein
MRNRLRIIPVALACLVGAAGLHYRGGLSWAWVALATLLFFAGGALIVRSSSAGSN